MTPFRRCGRCESGCTTECKLRKERLRRAAVERWGIEQEGPVVVVHRGGEQS